MKYLNIFLIVILSLFITSCGKKEQVVDLTQYSEDYSVADFDSTYRLSEIGSSGGRKTVFLNIHCTATKEGYNLKGDWFLDFFKNNRNWDRPGYNEIIELDGNRFRAVPYNLDGYTTWDEVSYGVKGINSISINIAYVGGVDKTLKPKDTRTEAQKRVIDKIVHDIRCSLPDIVVMGHREHKGVNKACPSFDVYGEYVDVKAFINETREFDYSPDFYNPNFYNRDSLK